MFEPKMLAFFQRNENDRHRQSQHEGGDSSVHAAGSFGRQPEQGLLPGFPPGRCLQLRPCAVGALQKNRHWR